MESTTTDSELALDGDVPAHEGLDALYRRVAEGYRHLDAAAVASAYDEAAFYLPHDLGMQKGRQAIERDFASFFAWSRQSKDQLRVSFRIVDRKVNDRLAYDVGIHTLQRLHEGR